MRRYELRVSPHVDRALARLPESAATAIIEFMTGPLLENPLCVGGCLQRELSEFRAARRGPYRIVYWVGELEGVIIVERIDHRSDVYRKR